MHRNTPRRPTEMSHSTLDANRPYISRPRHRTGCLELPRRISLLQRRGWNHRWEIRLQLRLRNIIHASNSPSPIGLPSLASSPEEDQACDLIEQTQGGHKGKERASSITDRQPVAYAAISNASQSSSSRTLLISSPPTSAAPSVHVGSFRSIHYGPPSGSMGSLSDHGLPSPGQAPPAKARCTSVRVMTKGPVKM